MAMETNLMRELSTVNGFIARYLQHLTTSDTQVAAYEITEKEYESIFNRRRYADYNSFRVVKNRRVKAG
jgi:hypothetical protein